MASAFIFDLTFLVSYMIKRLIETAPSPPVALKSLYMSTAVIHGLVSTAVLLLTGSQVLLALKWRRRVEGRVTLRDERKIHRIMGITTLLLWYISFLTGLGMYAILYVL